jgi:DNA-binding IclR family transcriptional regulator
MPRAAPAAARAVEIISFLTAHPSRSFTISELARHLEMNIASAHATLAVLCDSGFVIRDPAHRTYRLGTALAASGFAVVEQTPGIQAAIEQADILAGELDAEIALSAIAGRDVIFLARRGPIPTSSAIAYPGDRMPLMAPIGAVFMAWASESAIEAWLRRAEVGEEGTAHLHRVLAEIRDRGFSVPLQSIATDEINEAVVRIRSQPADDDAERHLAKLYQQEGETLLLFEDLPPAAQIQYKVIAAPIFDAQGQVIITISVTGPDHPVPLAEVMKLGRRLTRSAALATREGRGRPPERRRTPRPDQTGHAADT